MSNPAQRDRVSLRLSKAGFKISKTRDDTCKPSWWEKYCWKLLLSADNQVYIDRYNCALEWYGVMKPSLCTDQNLPIELEISNDKLTRSKKKVMKSMTRLLLWWHLNDLTFKVISWIKAIVNQHARSTPLIGSMLRKSVKGASFIKIIMIGWETSLYMRTANNAAKSKQPRAALVYVESSGTTETFGVCCVDGIGGWSSTMICSIWTLLGGLANCINACTGTVWGGIGHPLKNKSTIFLKYRWSADGVITYILKRSLIF